MYQIVDANDEPVSETLFKSGREASEAKQVYLDHVDDLALPLKVVTATTEKEPDDEDAREGRSRIPCSKCGKLTTFDPIYQDLCYRCIRADNE